MTTVVVLSGDASQFLRELQKVENSEKGIERAFIDAAKAANATTESVERIGKAGQRGQSEIDKLLRELRKTGPEGGRAARAMEKSFQEAGTHGRRSVNEILKEIQKIDPAAVKAAKETREISKGFGPDFIGKITGVVTGYISLSTVMGEVTKYLREQEELMNRALDKQLTLAQAQQEAAKNLAAYSAVDRNRLLQEAVPDIARRTGFADLSQLTLALGTAASSGATPEQAISAVEAAANVDRLTPENVGSTAAGAVAIMRKTGITDARQAVALLQTAGTQAKIVDPAAMIKEMPAAVGATMSTVGGQDVSEAARQAASLFANITQAGEDVRGSSSATFQIDLVNRLGKFFQDIDKTRIDARSELQTLENKKNPVERDFVRMGELRKVIPQLEALNDPGSLFGRFQSLQQNPLVAREFVGSGFGEQRFRGILDQMVDPNSQFSQGLLSSFNSIQASADFYEGEVKNLQSGTPQAAVAFATGRAQAGIGAQQGFDTRLGGLGAIRDITSQALTETRGSGLEWIIQSLSDTGIKSGLLSGDNSLSEGISAVAALSARRSFLARGGIQQNEISRVQTIDTAIQSIVALMREQAATGKFTPDEVRAAQREASGRAGRGALVDERFDSSLRESQNQLRETMAEIALLMRQQLEASQATAENTAPQRRPPNYGSALNSGAAASGRDSF